MYLTELEIEEIEDKINILRNLPFSGKEHTSRRFSDHLIGTCNLLRKWNAPVAVCIAGLFHGIYGTEFYLSQSVSINDRKYISNLIGELPERLAFYFCAIDRSDFMLKAISENSFTVYSRFDSTLINLNEFDVSALLFIVASNFLEIYNNMPDFSSRKKEFEYKHSTNNDSFASVWGILAKKLNKLAAKDIRNYIKLHSNE